MSRIVRQRFEVALYDDAQGSLVPSNQVPPTYPPSLQHFATTSLQSSTVGFSTTTLTGSGAQTISVSPGATLVFSGDTANTTLLRITVPLTPVVPGGTPREFSTYVGPNQLVTLPGPLNSGTIVLQPVTVTLTTTSAPYSLDVMSY